MSQPPLYDSTGIEYYTIPQFSFSNGTTLHDVKVAYRQFNASSTAGTVLIPTCYGGHINTTLTLTNGPHDALAHYRVIVVAMLGNGESSSHSNKAFFPEPGELRYQDLVRAQHALLTEHLKVERLLAVIGFSMGGQQAYHWGVMYPEFVGHVVAICSSARTSAHNYAFLEGPIAALTNSIDYIAWRAMKKKVADGEDVGQNLKDVVPKHGIRAFARTYAAWLTSAAWFRDREWSKGVFAAFGSLDEWMKAREDGYLIWDAQDLLVLARMWQLGDVGDAMPGEEVTGVKSLGYKVPDDARYEKALRSIKAKVLLLPCRSDQYFPPEDSEIEVGYLQSGRVEVIESTWGHVAGGGLNPPDTAFLNERIGRFLAEK
ncbi:hypothetical protein LTR84_007743 [Exophiala bonariae]|uniref:AB hydrolase-1 domain-containing protein n=1 Tax=Exophiala bonariae TaxID=1690606 RepID=A0AAV9NMJ9_9EURO|nr:hypothetical protein LTR84_007743 [Exophiala bonariae]